MNNYTSGALCNSGVQMAAIGVARHEMAARPKQAMCAFFFPAALAS
jgi:hypothetical protein